MYFDIETIPLPEQELLEMAPEELRNPTMPEHIANPVIPSPGELEPPKYGGDVEKQNKWRDDKHKALVVASEQAKSDWKLKQGELLQRFMENAALEAPTLNVKVCGMRFDGVTHMLVYEVNPCLQRQIRKGPWPELVQIHLCATEKLLLEEIFRMLKKHVGMGGHQSELIGYYTHIFDLPVLFRRAWILGVVPPYWLRTGRYFNSDLSIDLDEVWKMGDRQTKTGGLNGLCKTLAVQQKSGNGANFWKMYRDDPVDAICYCIGDLDATEGCAKKMGLAK